MYAFGLLEDDCRRVQGGTRWTVQLALDQGKKVFVYDIESEAWFHSVCTSNKVQGSLEVGAHFVTLSDRDKPTLHQNSAVVGTRALDEKTRQEIRDLFHRTFARVERKMKRVCFNEETQAYHPVMHGHLYCIKTEPLSSEEDVQQRRSPFQTQRQRCRDILRHSRALRKATYSEAKRQKRQKRLDRANAAWQPMDTDTVVDKN